VPSENNISGMWMNIIKQQLKNRCFPFWSGPMHYWFEVSGWNRCWASSEQKSVRPISYPLRNGELESCFLETNIVTICNNL
jgi:hypothetical protein